MHNNSNEKAWENVLMVNLSASQNSDIKPTENLIVQETKSS